jgi:hypothetical protein
MNMCEVVMVRSGVRRLAAARGEADLSAGAGLSDSRERQSHRGEASLARHLTETGLRTPGGCRLEVTF